MTRYFVLIKCLIIPNIFSLYAAGEVLLVTDCGFYPDPRGRVLRPVEGDRLPPPRVSVQAVR